MNSRLSEKNLVASVSTLSAHDKRYWKRGWSCVERPTHWWQPSRCLVKLMSPIVYFYQLHGQLTWHGKILQCTKNGLLMSTRVLRTETKTPLLLSFHLHPNLCGKKFILYCFRQCNVQSGKGDVEFNKYCFSSASSWNLQRSHIIVPRSFNIWSWFSFAVQERNEHKKQGNNSI